MLGDLAAYPQENLKKGTLRLEFGQELTIAISQKTKLPNYSLIKTIIIAIAITFFPLGAIITS